MSISLAVTEARDVAVFFAAGDVTIDLGATEAADDASFVAGQVQVSLGATETADHPSFNTEPLIPAVAVTSDTPAVIVRTASSLAVVAETSTSPAVSAVTRGSMNYTLGQTAVITAMFASTATPPVALTPAALTLRIQPPTGAETDVSTGFGNPTVGTYTYSLTLNQSGVWRYRWEAGGSFVTAIEGAIYVPSSPFSYDL